MIKAENKRSEIQIPQPGLRWLSPTVVSNEMMTSLFPGIQYGVKGKYRAYHARRPALCYIVFLLVNVPFSAAST